jgi:putative ABC transport system ATP-binding protein
MSGAVLAASGLALDYVDGARTQSVLRDVNLAIGQGEFVGLMGPSGSGKSSFLFVLAGLREPSRGDVRLFGEPWSRRVPHASERRRRQIGLVFQDPFLVSYLTLRENAAVQALGAAAQARIEPLADALGIRDLLDKLPERLSAGERQRASILRALVNAPAIVLADEPTAHLDRANGERVVHHLVETARGASLLVTTHDPTVLERADRVLRLVDGTLVE